jgi:phosphoglucomutase/phosphomannomutase
MPDRLDEGFAALDVDADLRRTALANLRRWLEAPAFAAYQPQLKALVDAGRWAFLLDSFYRTIPFGTGGRRGPVGIGPNRINAHTITTSVQGHVDYLRRKGAAPPSARSAPSTGASAPVRVVVAFDSRIFKDLRGLYDASLPNSLLGMRSRDFARLAAGVYAANGIEVVTVSGDDLLLSTPELSFAIRRLGAVGGLNISASHNHPDDNGAKFYTDYGGQPIAPHDEEMAGAVAAVQRVESIGFDDAVARGLVRWWDGHEAYLQASLDRSLDRGARDAAIVYSPLHGTGRHTVYDVLCRAGFKVALVAGQADPDGEFPHVKFRIPNPEVREAMEAASAEALASRADAAMASDPDADRIGLVAVHRGGPRFLSGNEIAALLTAYVVETLAAQGRLPRNAFVVKTGVTTELMAEIARRNGVQVVGDLLVGFKYVAAVLEDIQHKGEYRGLKATLDDFLVGAEESHGVLVTPAMRDKDAAGGALLLAELIAVLKRKGQTVVDYLEDVYRRYGYFATAAYSLIMEGVTGLRRMDEMMAGLRGRPPGEILGRRVTHLIDYWDTEEHGPILSETDRSSRNVVALYAERGLKLTVRPSGTEPKLKIYVEGGGREAGADRAAIAALVRDANQALAQHLLAYLGIRLAPAALELSQLVSVESRIDFGERFLPELKQKVAGAAAAELQEWADRRLQAYGKDPRFLVAPGVAAALGDAALRPYAQLLRRVFPLAA